LAVNPAANSGSTNSSGGTSATPAAQNVWTRTSIFDQDCERLAAASAPTLSTPLLTPLTAPVSLSVNTASPVSDVTGVVASDSALESSTLPLVSHQYSHLI